MIRHKDLQQAGCDFDIVLVAGDMGGNQDRVGQTPLSAIGIGNYLTALLNHLRVSVHRPTSSKRGSKRLTVMNAKMVTEPIVAKGRHQGPLWLLG